MCQAVLSPNLTKKFQWEVSKIANNRFPLVMLSGGLSVNLNHLKMTIACTQLSLRGQRYLRSLGPCIWNTSWYCSAVSTMAPASQCWKTTSWDNMGTPGSLERSASEGASPRTTPWQKQNYQTTRALAPSPTSPTSSSLCSLVPGKIMGP